MRDAVLSGLGAIHERPDLAEVIVLNRLRSRNLPPSRRVPEEVLRSSWTAEERGYPLRTPFGNERTVTGVISGVSAAGSLPRR